MKWGTMVKKWFNQEKKNQNDLFFQPLGYSFDEADCPDQVELLKEKGLQLSERKEVLIAVNILSCNIIGDLEIEVEKMFAHEVLRRFGFQGVEQFETELKLFRQKHSDQKSLSAPSFLLGELH